MSDQCVDPALARTRRWLEGFVIAQGLCPFAAAPFHAERICYRVSSATTLDAVYQDFLALLDEFCAADPRLQETALLILSAGLASFDDYLEALGVLEQAIAEAGLEGQVQIASFHPAYCFAEADPDDPANFSNRSPLPMFHLIREAGLTAALESFSDPERIPERNVRHLRQLGLSGIRSLLGDDWRDPDAS